MKRGNKFLLIFLSFQFNDYEFPSLSGGRIVRIATHPDYQGVSSDLTELTRLVQQKIFQQACPPKEVHVFLIYQYRADVQGRRNHGAAGPTVFGLRGRAGACLCNHIIVSYIRHLNLIFSFRLRYN